MAPFFSYVTFSVCSTVIDYLWYTYAEDTPIGHALLLPNVHQWAILQTARQHLELILMKPLMWRAVMKVCISLDSASSIRS